MEELTKARGLYKKQMKRMKDEDDETANIFSPKGSKSRKTKGRKRSTSAKHEEDPFVDKKRADKRNRS